LIPVDVPARLADSFRQLFGRYPDGIWHAPGRVNIIGEHTDYNGGRVLPFAISLGTKAAIALRGDHIVRVASAQYPDDGVVSSTLALPKELSRKHWSIYPIGVAWVLSEAGLSNGVDILIDSDLPEGAGLSSSAALQCALALGISELAGLCLSRDELVRIAQRAETEAAGVPCGTMDQSASLLSIAKHALLLDTSTGDYEHVPFDPEEHGLCLIVADTGVRHRLSGSKYALRRSECHQAAAALGVETLCELTEDDLESVVSELAYTLARRVRHVVTENSRVARAASLLQEGALVSLGDILCESHRSLASDFEVSWPQADLMVEAASHSGALGARMVGGGFGGSVLVLCERSRAKAVVAALEQAVPPRGHMSPIISVMAASGARRLV